MNGQPQGGCLRHIQKCAERNPVNRGEDGSRYFNTPLVGFASAQDNLFASYKTIIGSFHWTPSEVLGKVYGPGCPPARTVICWVLPITEKTRLNNRNEDRYSSRRWAHTRHFGEQFNDLLRKSVVDFLVEKGECVAAPMLMDDWSRVDDPKIGLASTWSERHAAFAAGLGTFSLNDGFITPRGIGIKFGVKTDGCGLCQTDVPCESVIPDGEIEVQRAKGLR